MIRRVLQVLAGVLVLIAILLGGAFYLSRPDVPPLVPNVNDKPVGTFAVETVTMHTFYDDEVRVDEGRIVVPENRTSEASNHIELFFRVMRTEAADPRPPVFFFAGGPGSSSTRVAQTTYFYLFREIQEFADVVLLDQRGTGGSNPNLQCYNQLGLPTDITVDVPAQAVSAVAEAVGKCADRFRREGVDLAAYNSAESAHDIEALRKALGYETISLFGYSYGTTLAQFYIRLYPDRVARSVMAGPVATDEALKLPARVNGKFEAMDSLLAADPLAVQYMPSLLELMNKVHAALRAKPQFIQLPLMDAVSDEDGVLGKAVFQTISLVKPHWELTLTDQHLQMMMATRGGNPTWTRKLPSFYYAMHRGDFQEAGNFLRNFRRETLPNLLFFTASCATRYSEARWAEASATSSYALTHTGISFGRFPEVCDAVGVPKLPGLSDPVTGETPLLLIASTLDTQTPVANMRVVASRFPDPVTVIVENASHTDLIFPETGETLLQFLQGELVESSVQHKDGRRALRFRRPISFDPLVPYRYSLQDTLFAVTQRHGVEAAVARYEVIRRENALQDEYLWDLGENSLNALGYRFLRAGMTEEAIRIFELNTAVFPKAYNPFNSLGEAYLLAGRVGEARRALNRALELNRYDGNSYKLLNQMEANK